jgi:hypothetical protein
MHCIDCKNFVLVLHSKEKYELQIDKQQCYGCGVQIGKTFDFYHCRNCKKYFLCFECRYCKEGHFLQKVIYLENLGYIQNIFECDVCGKEDKPNDDGIWHCQSCNYDVCQKCLP